MAAQKDKKWLVIIIIVRLTARDKINTKLTLLQILATSFM